VGHQKLVVGFLDDAHGPLGAQGLLGRALVGVDLIDSELELPTGVVGDDDLPSGGEIRVQQRGDQAMFYPMAGAVGILQGVADHSHRNRGELPRA
jgi:hypothetical protein